MNESKTDAFFLFPILGKQRYVTEKNIIQELTIL